MAYKEKKTIPRKRVKSNFELSQSIRKKRASVKKLTQTIKDNSIRKNKLLNSIEEDVEELTQRFKK